MMKSIFIFGAALLSTGLLVSCGGESEGPQDDLEWFVEGNIEVIHKTGLSGGEEYYLETIEVDDAGNTFVAGQHDETLHLKSNDGTPFKLTPNGDIDCFVLKIDPSGQILWGHSLGTELEDEMNEAVLTSDGGIVLVGQTRGSLMLNGELWEGGINFQGDLIAKFSSDGALEWAATNTDSRVDSRYENVTADGQGNTYAGTTCCEELSAENSSGYVRKYDGSGNNSWQITLNTPKKADSYLALDANGSNELLIAGAFRDIMTFESATGTTDQLELDQYQFTESMFISKWNQTGEKIWVKVLTKAEVLFGKLDEQGNIYLSGRFKDGFDADPGPEEVLHYGHLADLYRYFVLKLDPDGNYLWSDAFQASRITLNDMVLSSGKVWLAMGSKGTIKSERFENEETIMESSPAYTESTLLVFDQTDGAVETYSAQSGAPTEHIMTAIDVKENGKIYYGGEFGLDYLVDSDLSLNPGKHVRKSPTFEDLRFPFFIAHDQIQ